MFGIVGKLLAAPVRLVNAPLKAMEKLASATDDDEPIISLPLDALADAIEDALDDE